ncbi:MAG: ATP-dependent DNA helicase [Sporolactobacillus sp.]
MDEAKVVTFDFGNANERQKEAIQTSEGPLLISAGPGTGKTFTLVNRIVYLIQEKNVAPEKIFVATFTEKAAKELLTRISNEMIARNIEMDINEMYVGTFHSLCMRIIRENLEYSSLGKNFSLLDSFDQQYFIYQNLWSTFNPIPDIELITGKVGIWNKAKKLLALFNGLTEEMIDEEELLSDSNPELKVLGQAKVAYDEHLRKRNCLDFSSIQSECLLLLKNNPSVLEKYLSQFEYLMIDEYQDTNSIQEQLIFLLGGEKQNICVVGDDDQALYRFRGATIRNILEFSKKFPEGAKLIKLEDNYRSTPYIVNFYNEWIVRTEGEEYGFEWADFRIPKRIKAFREKRNDSDAVFKVSGIGSTKDWHQKVLRMIEDIKPNITDLNQIAFLFKSVRSDEARELANYLEKNGISVYSPRSDMFFEREEVKTVLGMLLMMFPQYGRQMASGEYDKWLGGFQHYYKDCLETAATVIKEDKHIVFWLQDRIMAHATLKRNIDYALSGLFYQMLQFDYFKKFIEMDLSKGVTDQRGLRNLSIISNLLAKFEYNENISVLTKKNFERTATQFFNNFLRFLKDGGIDEYQDESEYAPSGCVSFLTIHQSKGMEFPIVFVGGLGGTPRKDTNDLLQEVYDKYADKDEFEPLDRMKFFDFWRLYYVAFSRAQDMLILTTEKREGRGRRPSKYFTETYVQLKEYNPSEIDLASFDFNEVKETNLKQSYAFTSDIALYEKCSLQYKMYRELGFSPVRIGSTLFGSLVHQTIEDVHKAVLRGEENTITEDNIDIWFRDNYRTLAETQRSYLGEAQLGAAEKQVMNYVENNRENFNLLKEAEVNVSLVQKDYILNGQIDLVKGQGDTVEIIDFKAEKKPDLHSESDKYEQYKKQLEVYAYLLEQKYGLTVSKMHLYYTGAENENPRISFNRNNDVIENMIAEFDKVVASIQKKDFTCLSDNLKLCSNCDMRYYCGRAERKG